MNYKNKTLVIDTSVFIYDPEALTSFVNARIILPFTVIEELESFGRHHRDETSKNASRALSNIRLLIEESIVKEDGFFSIGNSGNTLKIEVLPVIKDNHTGKFLVIELLKLLKEKETILFVTKSLGRRVRAESIGIESSDYENKRFSFSKLYKGYTTVDVSREEIEHFYKDAFLTLNFDEKPAPNQYFFLRGGEQSFALARYDIATKRVIALSPLKDLIWGIKPLNLEQKCALDLLLRDDIKLVSLIGQAGSGKTILALASAMHQVFDKGEYTKLLVSRPIVPMGRDIGFLPGEKDDKLAHWMQPIYDNLEFLCGLNKIKDYNETIQELIASNKLEMEALTYIRGRSLPQVFMIIDEAQNLTPHEIKTIISRAGNGTKIVLTGDPTQIDSPYFDENSNGLTYLVGKFQHLPLYGHMFLNTTERSELAAAAANHL